MEKPDKALTIARKLVRVRRCGDDNYDLVVIGQIESSWAKTIPQDVIEEQVNRIAAGLRKAGVK